MISGQPSQLPLFNSFATSGGWRLFYDTWRVILLGWRIFVPLVLILAGTRLIQFLIENGYGGNNWAIGPWASVLAYVVFIVLGWLTVVAMLDAADAVSERQSVSIATAYSTALRRFWPYLVTVMLVYLIVVEGSVLLVAPGILLELALYPAIYAALLEGLRPREALARSRFLTMGNRWKILVRTFAFWILCLILFWIPLAVIFGRPDLHWIKLPPINGYISGPAADTPDPAWFPYASVPGGALWVLLFGVFMVLLFKSLRAERGEGATRAPLWPAAVSIAIGLLLALYSIPGLLGTKHLLEHAVPVMGTLVAPTTVSSAGGAVTVDYSVAVEFSTPDGIKHQFHTMLTQAGVTDQPLGSRIPVIYDQADPADARINTWFLIWGEGVLASVSGAALFLVGLFQWIYLRRSTATVSPVLVKN